MSIIDKNQPNWFGNNGEPLKSGYIYIGQPNQTPVEFPKTVTFTDSSGSSFPATQPLRTNSDGQIVWNGKAIIATVDGDYSMLVLNSTQTQINGGYVPFVEGDASSVITLTDYREYGLLLADIKQLDVAPAQTVGNIGKTTATDTLGSDWLVVSNTGGPADDIDLIDFDNGLQGTRIYNPLAPPVFSGYTSSQVSYITTDAANATVFDVGAATPISTFTSVGPTGSGASDIWTALDALPSNTKWIDVSVVLVSFADGSGLSIELNFYTRQLGSSAAVGFTTNMVGSLNLAGAVGSVQTLTGIVRIPVDATKFECAWKDTNTNARSVSLYLRGFGV